ncbi:major facilitator superfamily domain-containing protein [Radiomyces spectabilis]|uniref:major facilitator superfamily domain-containing protein n=1 Tax=Radiomyces spectabilis TaxID=64574 RepID=UPI00221FF452|nr:major facilitator superfamily domain-containing protein [Radiomyces spectabilis]KAI8377403.1 major facilitator superfamily domain-containing protein [Radiomyces spectabilis]
MHFPERSLPCAMPSAHRPEFNEPNEVIKLADRDNRTDGSTTSFHSKSLSGTQESQISTPIDDDHKEPPQCRDIVDISLKMKILILTCMLWLPVGCHYMEATMGTLKTTLKKTMHINNTQFSILLSCVSLVNTVLPLWAGTMVDDLAGLGSIRSTTLVSCVILTGSILVSIAFHFNSYPIMITGQIIYGLGGGMIVTMQEAIVSRWFRDRQLAVVVGIMLCIARLTKWAAKMVCYPIIDATGSNAWPIIIANILCAVGVLMNIVYWAIMYHHGGATMLGKEIQVPGSFHANDLKLHRDQVPSTSSHKPSFRWSSVLFLYVPGIFWMVPWVQLIMSSVLSSFDDVATEFVQFRFNTDRVMAGYQSSLTQVVPIVAAPLLGLYVHRYGKRLTILFFGTIVLLISMVLLAYTWVTPAVGMIIFSSAVALGPVAVLSSTPLLLPSELAGTGMGLHKCANNIGTTIVSVLVGYVQDLTYHDGDPSDNTADLQTAYDGVMVFYLVLACGSIFVSLIFWFMDRRQLQGWLQANQKERQRRIDTVKAEQALYQSDHLKSSLRMVGSQLRTKRTFIYVSIFCFWLVVSWAIFFSFALMPIYQRYSVT